jgi:hypothetical protein
MQAAAVVGGNLDQFQLVAQAVAAQAVAALEQAEQPIPEVVAGEALILLICQARAVQA